jgi:hypothetical protein
MNEGPALSSAMGLVRFAFLNRFVCAYKRLKMGLSALLRHLRNEVEQIEVTLIKLKFVITRRGGETRDLSARQGGVTRF